MATYQELSIPGFFDPKRVKDILPIRKQERQAQALDWAKQHGIKNAALDGKGGGMKICLLAIDNQLTFCHPDFELFVGGRSGTGALEDTVRLCEFIYRNLGVITRAVASLDTHAPGQIFFPEFWVNAKGEHPAPMTMIGVDDLDNGIWQVNPTMAHAIWGDASTYSKLRLYAHHYVSELARKGRYQLTIWPYHAMLGEVSHALMPLVYEAFFFHSIARGASIDFEVKGGNPLTENYSIGAGEVLEFPKEINGGAAFAQRNVEFLKILVEYDLVIIAGQAKSHCVAWTIAEILDRIMRSDPALAGKVYLLEDCTSPVVIPGVVDFTEQADQAFERFKSAGMHVVRSTDPIESWPNVGSLAI